MLLELLEYVSPLCLAVYLLVTKLGHTFRQLKIAGKPPEYHLLIEVFACDFNFV